MLVVLEFVLAPALLHRVPLAFHRSVHERAIGTLMQSSKARTIPRDYVALVGDSYAAGDGDWMRSVDAGSNPPFHSAHLIHDATGRDVLSFGYPGSGSLRALVSEPLGQTAYLARTARYAIDDPRELYVYFYEGNDLEDNVEDLRRRFDEDWDAERLYDAAYFRRFIDEEVLGRDHSWLRAEGFRFRENFFVVRNLRYRLAERLAAWRAGGTAAPEAPPTRARGKGPRINRVVAGGEVVKVGRSLQGPGVVLEAGELERAVYVFEQALAVLVERFPGTRVTVVYVPSPLVSYASPDEEAWVFAVFFRERDGRYARSAVVARSNAVCERIAQIAAAEGAGFADARPVLRAASERGVLHGPKDWRHFNRAGYQALADVVVADLDGGSAAGCARLD